MVEISSQTTFSATRPRLLFTGSFVRTADRVQYDVSPDGEHFVMLNPGEHDQPATQISVLLNWSQELLERVPVD